MLTREYVHVEARRDFHEQHRYSVDSIHADALIENVGAAIAVQRLTAAFASLAPAFAQATDSIRNFGGAAAGLADAMQDITSDEMGRVGTALWPSAPERRTRIEREDGRLVHYQEINEHGYWRLVRAIRTPIMPQQPPGDSTMAAGSTTVTVAKTAKKTPVPTRRRIGRATAPEADTNALAEISRAMGNYATARAQVEAAQRRMNEEASRVQKLMTEAKLTEHQKDGLTAHWHQTRGKLTTFIPVDKFRKALGPNGAKTFDASVKVSITEARKHLTGQEIARIATESGGELGDPAFIIEPTEKVKK